MSVPKIGSDFFFLVVYYDEAVHVEERIYKSNLKVPIATKGYKKLYESKWYLRRPHRRLLKVMLYSQNFLNQMVSEKILI